ncbi:hypothetical protein SEA_ALEEMILY_106 [Gordonia phage Aleemily]|uniref:Uncharacterized protein n=1 Tax=Gordonia phage Aleemily TaxID=2965181 RepID=A0A9E7TYC7_9CAUD|nr:hypothetical protein SEA_ALEEMILY_106 [Gordonia phage Aleemily]
MTALPPTPPRHWWLCDDHGGQMHMALQTAYDIEGIVTVAEQFEDWHDSPRDNAAQAYRMAAEILKEVDIVGYRLSRLVGFTRKVDLPSPSMWSYSVNCAVDHADTIPVADVARDLGIQL